MRAPLTPSDLYPPCGYCSAVAFGHSPVCPVFDAPQAVETSAGTPGVPTPPVSRAPRQPSRLRSTP